MRAAWPWTQTWGKRVAAHQGPTNSARIGSPTRKSHWDHQQHPSQEGSTSSRGAGAGSKTVAGKTKLEELRMRAAKQAAGVAPGAASSRSSIMDGDHSDACGSTNSEVCSTTEERSPGAGSSFSSTSAGSTPSPASSPSESGSTATTGDGASTAVVSSSCLHMPEAAAAKEARPPAAPLPPVLRPHIRSSIAMGRNVRRGLGNAAHQPDFCWQEDDRDVFDERFVLTTPPFPPNAAYGNGGFFDDAAGERDIKYKNHHLLHDHDLYEPHKNIWFVSSTDESRSTAARVGGGRRRLVEVMRCPPAAGGYSFLSDRLWESRAFGLIFQFRESFLAFRESCLEKIYGDLLLEERARRNGSGFLFSIVSASPGRAAEEEGGSSWIGMPLRHYCPKFWLQLAVGSAGSSCPSSMLSWLREESGSTREEGPEARPDPFAHFNNFKDVLRAV